LAETESCSTSVSPGSFTYTVGSSSATGYIIQAGGANSWGPVSASGSQITVGKGPRFYLANSCASSFSPTVFSAVKLLGGSITFTANLANIGCGQNAAFYLVGMPGAGATSNGDYYCDANCVGGQCCPEMDLMEANRHALQVTPHKCSSATGGCDAGGCAKNTQSISNGFGPSSSFTINTLNSFTVKITFSGSTLSGITTVISQGSKSIQLTHGSECGSGYLSAFGSSLSAGMVPVWSFWTGSMGWLDSPACSSDTSEVNGNFVFSNLIVGGSVSSTKGPPSTPVTPTAPTAPGTLQCGTSGTTNNQNWVEFKPPSTISASAAASATATVSCSNTATVYTCSWFSAGSKFQCGASGAGCSNPVATVNGKKCILTSSLILEDGSASSSLSSNQNLIIGGSVGAACLVIIVIVIVVIFKKKDDSPIEVA